MRNNISVLVPVYNEQESIPILAEKIIYVMQKAELKFELIFIDDGSTDTSWKAIQNISHTNSEVRGIKLRRNFGKSQALDSGIQSAKGDIIITMDGDLQDDPEEISNLLNKVDEGFDLVIGWKRVRNDPLGKRLPSKIFNYFTSLFAGIKIHDFNSGFKVYKKEVFSNLHIYGELHRYIPFLAHNLGYKVVEVPVKHHPRKYGKSKFGAERYLKGFIDLLTVVTITKYDKRPAHLFGGIGIVLSALGFVILSYLSALWLFTTEAIGSRPLLLLGVLLVIVGLQMAFFGMLAEFILYRSTVTKKRNVVESEVNSGAE